SLLLTILSGCKKNSHATIMRVNHYTVSCTGEMTGKCLLVQRGENLNTDKWEYFYFHNSIKGFDYEEGYVYTIEVLEEKVKNPPMDGSSISFALIEIVSKEKY
ncbi:MAG TPA: DUF4377 domain-containing protein, partial [Pedobacter sp.]